MESIPKKISLLTIDLYGWFLSDTSYFILLLLIIFLICSNKLLIILFNFEKIFKIIVISSEYVSTQLIIFATFLITSVSLNSFSELFLNSTKNARNSLTDS